MTTYYEQRETASVAEREKTLFSRLPEALQQARQRASAIAQQLQGVEPGDVRDRASLGRIPVIRKSELLQAQLSKRQAGNASEMSVQDRLFGGFSTIGWGEAARVFASPGPIYEPESRRADYWGFARALYAAGFRSGDLVYNCFSYHFTPAGSMMETAAHALGCTVFPGGVGQTEQQLQAMVDLQPTGYTGTPSFLRILLEKAEETGVPITSVKRALFSGEAFPPSLQAWFKERGIDGYQAYGTADLGMIAYETEAREGLVVNEDILLEIVRPGTNQAVAEGEVGEVVVTTLNPDYPLLRFGTGDLSAIMPGASPCGRGNLRIRGWLGRADQTTKVRGMFVHPAQVAQVVARYPNVLRARLVVAGSVGRDSMVLRIEVPEVADGLAESVADTVREITKLRAEVECLEPGALPNDGKVIEDVRDYE
ncbi:AMP-binding protein [Achromobacter sp. F4_2707]|uniref:phenylacetate--CoA ligase family protein n=1 Tax=Achromobacter sp. F4_2707 TaxID=3114286 RepID=UPI0039C6A6E7